ncbi:ankyrin-2-like [Phymastichus coffea]|uniref:ankyrin-2-like n=1 Tax=Phymastichus coffea TaxID=108790 RepID=UPI00273C0820|nr:ankyrin-2-like [Phymastichus coffea]
MEMAEKRESHFDSRLMQHIQFGRANEANSMLNEELARASDEQTNTLLHYAVLGQSPDIVQHLVELGAEIDLPGKGGNSPLELAIERVDAAAFNAPEERGEDRAAADGFRAAPAPKKLRVKILELLVGELRSRTLDTEQLADKLLSAGFNLLHCVAHSGDEQLLRCMLQRGLDANSRDHCGRTALHLAVMRNQPRLARLLLEHGADVDRASRVVAGRPILIAASNGYRDTMKVLLEAGADPNATFARIDITALRLVFKNFGNVPVDESDECLQLLLEHGAIPRNFSRLLDIALDKNEPKKINMLINHLAMLGLLGRPITKSDVHCKQDRLRSTIPAMLDSCREFLKRELRANLTVLELLTNSKVRMKILVRNDDLMGTLEILLSEDQNNELFPYYCSALNERIAKARRTAELEDVAVAVLLQIMHCYRGQCELAARIVVDYLNDEDLEQLSLMF